MELTAIVYRDEGGEGWVVECPEVPGCVSQGDTREEALESIHEAAELLLEGYAEYGWPSTNPQTDDIPKTDLTAHRISVAVPAVA